LEKAISELGMQDRVEIEWQPFELNPNMPNEGQNVQAHLLEKYGATSEQQKASQQNMAIMGAELGFTFDYFDKRYFFNAKNIARSKCFDFFTQKNTLTRNFMTLTRNYF
jgi:predicted DsbA family dithiol-disulfide isomerase